jgi:DNA uptake protein ComE-like DNA-binding protein
MMCTATGQTSRKQPEASSLQATILEILPSHHDRKVIFMNCHLVTVFALLFGSLIAIGGTACNNDPNATRQQAANATEELKKDSREAAGDIKKGAATAQTQLTAAAQGVKEGLGDKNSSQVDLNNANKAQLMGLPGINENRANAIIADRPYDRTHDVVRKGAITEDEYQQIAGKVSAGSAGK